MGCEKRIVTTTREIRVYTCDVCGATTDGTDWCQLCDRVLCRKHVGERLYPGGGDLSEVYCESCWDAGAEARQALEALESERDERADELREAWRTAAAAKLKDGA